MANAIEKLTLQAIPVEHPYPTHFNFRYTAAPQRTLFVIVDAGLPGYGGYRLKTRYQEITRTPEYPKEIRFLHKGALLSLGSEHKLSVLVQGIPTVKFEISRVLPNEVNHLITQTSGHFSNPYFASDYFDKNDLSELFSEIKQFNQDDSAKPQYTALDLDQYLKPNPKNPQPLGLFLLTAKSWDTQRNTSTGTEVSRLILMTDMGLIIKNNADNSHDVFVQSISSGEPVADAHISILGKNGLAIASGITDKLGHVKLPAVNQFDNDQQPTVYLARKGSDESFMPFAERDRSLNFSRFDVGGITDANEIHNLSADVFSDRGIYRPGDIMHFGLVIKQAYAHLAGVGIPVEAVLTDPRGVTVLDKKMSVTGVGLLTLDYSTQENSLTGSYTLTLNIIKDNRSGGTLGSTDVQLAEFLPDTLKMSSRLTTEYSSGWVTPDGLGAKIALQNLYGTPAMNRKVTGKIVLSPRNFYFSELPDYIFHDSLYDPKKPPHVIVEDLPDQQTDAQGQAQFDFDLGRFDKGNYQLTFYTQGFGADSGRSVSAENSLLVSPLPYLIGYKTDGNVNFIKQDSQRSLHLLAVNPQLQKIAVPHLTLQLLKQSQVATLVQRDDGTYQYEILSQETPVTKTTLDLPATGYDYRLPTHWVGDYALVITGADGVVMNRMTFSVAGRNQSNLQKNTELTVKLDKLEYHSGEDIRVQMTSPYTGSGLITIERDKVYAYKWFTTTSTNSVQTMAVPKDLLGNGYINVTFVRDWNSPEIFLSPLSYRVVPFNVNRSTHAIKIDLQVPNEIKPGQTLPIQYSANHAGKIIVFAVDEGILQVADYTTPDPLGYFFQKRALLVSTSQIVDQILPKFIAKRELSAVGGDDNAKIAQNYLNPFKRKTEKPVVFWSGIVDVDQQKHTLNYSVPDYFNASLRVMAVAVDDNAVGSAAQSSLIRGDFILTPTAPTVVAPGDKFDVSVNVTNNRKNSPPTPVSVTLATSSGLSILDKSTQTLTINAQQEKVAHFTVLATAQLGNAELIFTAEDDAAHHAHIQTTTSIRPATPFQTRFISGHEGSQRKIIVLPWKRYPDLAQQTVITADGPLIFLQGLQKYLESYPYGCTEQVSSKGFGYLAYKSATQRKLSDTIQILRQRQTSEGGFLYWPGMAADSVDSQFASIYALHFLTEAHDQGYAVPEELLRSGMNYLEGVARQPVDGMAVARRQAYAIYLLARNEIVPTNDLSNLQQYLEENYHDVWKNDIAGSFIAATYQILQDQKTADQLIGHYQLQSSKNGHDFFDASTNDALYIYLLARHFPGQFQALGDKVLLSMADEVAKGAIDTTSAAYTLLALSTYSPVAAHHQHSLSIMEIFADKKSQPLVTPTQVLTPADFSADAVKLQFNNPDRVAYFYQVYLAGYDSDFPVKPISQGFEVEREYFDNDKAVLGTVEQGTDITVHLKIRSITHQHYDHIAVVDLLPGGFELAPHSFSGNYDYFDAREDRVIFYTQADSAAVEITYHIKPVAKGDFIVPPPFAENMYNQRIMAEGIASHITVK